MDQHNVLQDLKTPLHVAAENGSLELAERLIKDGALLHALDKVSVFHQ